MVHRFFQEIRDGLLLQQELTKIAEHRALEDVKSLASRAFRRPCWDSEYSALLTLYKKLREDGQSVEAAVRGLLIAVLMSPSFSYHQTSLDGMDGVQPLDNYDVASRLSFFCGHRFLTRCYSRVRRLESFRTIRNCEHRSDAC